MIVPLGLWLAVRLIPPELMADYRRAAAQRAGLPASRVGLAVILLAWGAGATGVAWVFPANRASP